MAINNATREIIALFVKGCIGDPQKTRIHAYVEHCFNLDDVVVFVVSGDVSKVIGPHGCKIGVMAGLFEKKVKVVRASKNAEDFIRHWLWGLKCTIESGENIQVRMPERDLERAIGTNGKNANLLRQICAELYGQKEIIFKETNEDAVPQKT